MDIGGLIIDKREGAVRGTMDESTKQRLSQIFDMLSIKQKLKRFSFVLYLDAF